MELLEEYKQTIGLASDFEITALEDITAIARKHFQKYPFTTLSVHLSHDITLEPEALLKSLVTKGYGLCYHHNAAFYLLLNNLDVHTRFIATRVRKPGDHEHFLERETHVGLMISFEGQSYLFDPGFDGTSHCPLPLTGSEQDWYRVEDHQQHGYCGTLSENREGQYVPLYDFNRDGTQVQDWQAAYDYIASPDYPFWTVLLYSQAGADGTIYRLVSIVDVGNTLLVFSPGGELVNKVSSDEAILTMLEGKVTVPESAREAISEGRFVNESMATWVRRDDIGGSKDNESLHLGEVEDNVAAVPSIRS